MDLKLYNEEILFRINYLKLNSKQNQFLSSPLLVSPKCVMENNHKILYIGQELNTWVNQEISDDEISSSLLEDMYYKFLENEIYKSPYWKFISELVQPKSIFESVIWANSLICGKRYEKGTPEIPIEIRNISVEYLKTIYELVQPEKIIITSSAREPYYTNILKFLSLIGITVSDFPTQESPLITDETNTIFWTYHPNYLARKGIFHSVLDEAKIKVRK